MLQRAVDAILHPAAAVEATDAEPDTYPDANVVSAEEEAITAG
jgi:hypothetical protein